MESVHARSCSGEALTTKTPEDAHGPARGIGRAKFREAGAPAVFGYAFGHWCVRWVRESLVRHSQCRPG